MSSAPGPGQHLAFPFAIASNGRSATASTLDEQVLEELMQLVLTNQGERLFLPTFGGGARRLLFQGINDATATLANTMITQAVQQWLIGRATLVNLNVTIDDTAIQIEISYQVVGSTTISQAIFQRSAPSA